MLKFRALRIERRMCAILCGLVVAQVTSVADGLFVCKCSYLLHVNAEDAASCAACDPVDRSLIFHSLQTNHFLLATNAPRTRRTTAAASS